MAYGYGAFRTGVLDGSLVPAAKIPGPVGGGSVRCFTEYFDLSLAAVLKTQGTTNVVAGKPAGHNLLWIEAIASVGLGASQLSFGIAGSLARYGAAKAYGATPKAAIRWDEPVLDNLISDAGEQILMTNVNGGADLPNAGILVIRMYTAAKG